MFAGFVTGFIQSLVKIEANRREREAIQAIEDVGVRQSLLKDLEERKERQRQFEIEERRHQELCDAIRNSGRIF